MISLPHRTLIDLAPVEFARVAGEAGFDAVGFPLLAVRDDEPAWRLLEDPRALAEAAAALAAHGLAVLDVELLRLGPATRPADYRALFEAGARLGARFVCATADDPDERRVATHLAELCAEAAPFGLRIALEFMARSAVRTLAAAQRIVTTAAHPGASILVDACHFYQSGGAAGDLAAVDPRLFHYVQLNDVPGADASRTAAATRWPKVLPGDGGLPVVELLRALPAQVPVSLEVTGPDPAKRDAPAYARRAAAATRRTVSAARSS